jgi:hypothetical protein
LFVVERFFFAPPGDWIQPISFFPAVMECPSKNAAFRKETRRFFLGALSGDSFQETKSLHFTAMLFRLAIFIYDDSKFSLFSSSIK